MVGFEVMCLYTSLFDVVADTAAPRPPSVALPAAFPFTADMVAGHVPFVKTG